MASYISDELDLFETCTPINRYLRFHTYTTVVDISNKNIINERNCLVTCLCSKVVVTNNDDILYLTYFDHFKHVKDVSVIFPKYKQIFNITAFISL